jgi:hypothetical protein
VQVDPDRVQVGGVEDEVEHAVGRPLEPQGGEGVEVGHAPHPKGLDAARAADGGS